MLQPASSGLGITTVVGDLLLNPVSNVKSFGSIIPSDGVGGNNNLVFDLGSSLSRWKDVYGGNLNLVSGITVVNISGTQATFSGIIGDIISGKSLFVGRTVLGYKITAVDYTMTNTDTTVVWNGSGIVTLPNDASNGRILWLLNSSFQASGAAKAQVALSTERIMFPSGADIIQTSSITLNEQGSFIGLVSTNAGSNKWMVISMDPRSGALLAG